MQNLILNFQKKKSILHNAHAHTVYMGEQQHNLNFPRVSTHSVHILLYCCIHAHVS